MSFTPWAGTFVSSNTTITADFLNNYVKPVIAYAIDGRGGTYAPTEQLIVNGTYGLTVNGTAGLTVGSDGSTGLASCRVTGPVTLAGNTGRIAYRFPVTVLGDADADITCAGDIWRTSTAAFTAARAYTLRHTGAVTPVTGNVIRVLRRGLGAFALTVQREDLTPVWVTGNSVRTWCDFVWDGTSWCALAWESTGTVAVLTF